MRHASMICRASSGDGMRLAQHLAKIDEMRLCRTPLRAGRSLPAGDERRQIERRHKLPLLPRKQLTMRDTVHPMYPGVQTTRISARLHSEAATIGFILARNGIALAVCPYQCDHWPSTRRTHRGMRYSTPPAGSDRPIRLHPSGRSALSVANRDRRHTASRPSAA